MDPMPGRPDAAHMRSAMSSNLRSRSPTEATVLAGAWTLLALFALALAALLGRQSISLGVALGGGVLLLTGLALVLARYDLAVYIGFLLLAVVLVEPAPSDALFGLIMAVAAVTGRFGVRRLPRLAVWCVSGFLLLNLISASEVIDWSSAAKFFLITLYLCMFSLWLGAYIDRPTRARRLVCAYLFTAVLSAVLASAALFVHFPFHTLLIGDGERAKGLFKDPNVYGPFLVPIILILAEEILHPRLLRLRRSYMLACFLLLVLGVIFSYSRAAWLNLAIGLIVLIAVVTLRRPDRRAITLILVVLVGAGAIAGAIVVTGSLGFLEQRARLQSYDTSRFAAQDRGLHVGLEHPFGLGPGQFEVISPVASHSLYIRSLSEQGVLGLLTIIVLVIGTMAFALVSVLRGRDTYGISAAALLAAWCGLVANSFFVDTLHWRHLWLVAALIWAGAMRGRIAVPERMQRSASLSPPPASATLAGAPAAG
jgi:O-antigen ligase